MKKLLILTVVIFSWISLLAQRNCGTDLIYIKALSNNPELSRTYGRLNKISKEDRDLLNKAKDVVFKIPVVVHIVYNKQEDNVNLERIQKQIDRLNIDFRGRNNDMNKTPTEFLNHISRDCKIEFFLAESDPNGKPTNGITRTKTKYTKFGIISDSGREIEQAIKFNELGGEDAWSSLDYLNIWVGNIVDIDDSDKLLGYATFPGGESKFDGVVINTKYFGDGDFGSSNYNKGRTLTHEVGHWLNLHHIWGGKLLYQAGPKQYYYDYSCDADDGINDTPKQYKEYYHSPKHPKESCGSNDMFMNYMDYVKDSCMVMFTNGQRDQMRLTLLRKRKGVVDLSSEMKISDSTKKVFNVTSVTSFDKYWKCKSENDTCKYAYINWKPIENASSYSVSLRKVKSKKIGTSLNVDGISAKINGLKSNVLYEIEVRGVFEDGTMSASGDKYIFKLKGVKNIFKMKKPRLFDVN